MFVVNVTVCFYIYFHISKLFMNLCRQSKSVAARCPQTKKWLSVVQGKTRILRAELLCITWSEMELDN